ncbi:uncharacterized protein GLRG_00170 [Colletotrichum graminicola M1.001]|uniref:Uncharacterized protein n=1 Tax=Colletotrichum graminicola (strain M1.001 / M2 / FGSC 10212) TaxID=645133 RepID=E3Q347_COLGM|nr:uncharacterized protein GLRG_00170 [Colletotrichum graminicola M1.001]EFQ25026.1 hypothetical protein GLRG_00170 [Colletotrichum graminicola M1.001]
MSALGYLLRSRACKPEVPGARRQPINSGGHYSYWDDVEAEVPCAVVSTHIFGSQIQDRGHSGGP